MVSEFENTACELIVSMWCDFIAKRPQYGFEYSREHAVRYPGRSWGRIDLLVAVFNVKKKAISRIVGYEMKSSVEDLKNGSKLNFVHEYNYIVYPSKCERYVRRGRNLNFSILEKWLNSNKFERVGIIRIEEDGTLTIQREAKSARSVSFG